MDLKKYEKQLYKEGYKLIAGIDEAGRGPLIGPVVAACVVLPIDFENEEINDSKKLTEKKRERLFDIIKEKALAIGVGIASEKEIDDINIYQASKVAMKRALEDMKLNPDYVLIDAMPLELDIANLSIIKGDAKSITIAAASIIAKVTRDKMMCELALEHPEYGFEKHKGYPTKVHLEALKKYGVLKEHRRSYKPVKDLVQNDK